MKASKVVIALFLGCFLCFSVRADLLIESTPGFEAQQWVCEYTGFTSVRTKALLDSPVHIEGCQPLICSYTEHEAQISDAPGLFYMLDQYSPSYFPEGQYDLDLFPQARPAKIARDAGNSSLSLCLSALMSLGLYTSIPSIKKLSFGFIPHWYHHGGPCQIGHSIVVHPDSICPVPMYCFVQPVHGKADIVLQRHFGTVVSLWRNSQFTPCAIASRGPPDMS